MSESALGEADVDSGCKGKKYRDASWLRQKYVEEGLSGYEIAEICDIGDTTVYNWLDKHSIEAKDRTEACVKTEGKHQDSDWFYEKYVEEDLSLQDIAELCGICSWTANHWREKHGIDTHVTYATGKDHARYNSVEIECANCGEPMEIPKSRFESTERTCCSKECDAEHRREWLKGENHPMWKGGSKQWEYYGSDWQQKRKEALERDGFACQDCGDTENLHVHHIQPRRTFDETEEANKLQNLVVLCQTCHKKWEGLWLKPDVR